MKSLKQLQTEHPEVLQEARRKVDRLIRQTLFEEKLWRAGFCLWLKRNDLILLFANQSLGELSVPKLTAFVYTMR